MSLSVRSANKRIRKLCGCPVRHARHDFTFSTALDTLSSRKGRFKVSLLLLCSFRDENFLWGDDEEREISITEVEEIAKSANTSRLS